MINYQDIKDLYRNSENFKNIITTKKKPIYIYICCNFLFSINNNSQAKVQLDKLQQKLTPKKKKQKIKIKKDNRWH